MTDAFFHFQLALLQPQRSPITTNAIEFVIQTGLVLIVIIVALWLVFRALRRKSDLSITAEVRDEFEKSKEALLLIAQQKKAGQQKSEQVDREAEKQRKEIELLKENVDPSRVFGQICPLCRLEMMDDQELVIDPYTGQGYHFSSFLNDWPVDKERPQYIYRYPQGTIVKSEELLGTF